MSEKEMDQRNRNRNRAARSRQHRSITHHRRRQRETFDDMGLTKRNADYMFRFYKAFRSVKMKPDQKKKIVSQMVNELRTGQKTGLTARNKYGTVQHKIHVIVHPPKKVVPMNKNYWPNAFYNMLIFFVIFNVLYGVTYMISKQAQNEKGAAGIVGLVVTSVVAGLGMPIITRLFDDHVKHRYNGWIRGLIMIAMFLVWMGVFYLSAALPRTLNPVLNPWINIVMAVIGVGIAFWIHSNYHVTSAFRPVNHRN